MNNTARFALWFTVLCLLTPAGCGGHNAPTNLLVLGNSITFNPPNDRGWHGDWGMAAPSAADDFSHLTATALNVPLTVQTLYIEVLPVESLPTIPPLANQVGPGTTVVLEFGDDVPAGGLGLFAQDYALLAATLSKGNSLVCLSTWWENPSTDDVIKTICGTYGGRYVFIGDFYTDPDNADNKVIRFYNPRLQAHPGQWGHQHIADRVILMLRHY